ncbi:MAG: hypothetical protein JSU70_04650 [Phycisphaerales bacterium]|nr:MAG: hypothetical protein JSU70_04650 [Phycisphaerales bacterium]
MKRTLLKYLLCLAAIGLVDATLVTAADNTVARIDEALTEAARYMISKQAPDGAWRSETYGCFRDGPALTPYIMSCLYFLAPNVSQARRAHHLGVEYLMSLVDEEGSIRTGPRGLMFPVYTAASASRVVVLQSKSDLNKQAQAAWIKHLLSFQHTASLGWERSDPEYGGWGFSLSPPRKPARGQLRPPFIESNLTATIFGIGALRSARIPSDDPIWSDILVFVKRCQNFSADPVTSDPNFDDGGFFFCPGDPLQNKAGVAGTDRFGTERYHSYGSMSADGLRALLACGVAPSHPRVIAARRWLERSFSPKRHPGNFNSDREILREATYYYYVWSVAHAFTRLGAREIHTGNGAVNWAAALADELLRRRRPDGSWINTFTDAKEDDPLVATPWAAAALANCRHVLATDGDPSPDGCPRPKTDARTSFAQAMKGTKK